MYIVVWNDERLEEYEEAFEDIFEAECFMDDLPPNTMLFYEDDVRIRRII